MTVYEEIQAMLSKQEFKFKGKPGFIDDKMDEFQILGILTEECGEVAMAVNERWLAKHGSLQNGTRTSDEALRKELLQVCAVAVAWLKR